jgi:nucleotide-binding universal stress UspA family protein
VKRILLAVDDSPAGLAAARAAVELAAQTSARVRAIHVLADGQISRALHGSSAAATEERRAHQAAAVLHFVADLATRAAVELETASLTGEPAKVILDEAVRWPADLVVLGRAGDRHVGQPYIGSDVRRVLEFATHPVLVVPAVEEVRRR